ncbi:structure-specific endonuclease subunit SLX4 isoform X2 [Dunckerocampus dactyliophorus]|uniref:structure-specific endonuclease subunit SLX4 isoform X2 n=1 Tax=Dunckerocampus dactyliophorus TaxID=161453 RepID=UPI002406F1DC|nr:structure-specific endonuclease subunit SLX4 isoform X2 [Dunckerocampus dactyliophorus]
MNDSDQDFVDLCSKLLKRSRKKVEPKHQGRSDQKPSSQPSDGDKKRSKEGHVSHRVASESQCGRSVVVGKGGNDSGDAMAASGQRTEKWVGAKETVLKRMEHFKRTSPPRMVHKSQPVEMEQGGHPDPPQSDIPQSSASDFHLRLVDNDEVLAMRLQQELDREAAQAHTLDLDDGGLFFCQICHRDLSHMTPEGRTQHINRCLDDTEHQIAAPPPPSNPRPPGVPDCPICGKRFKSQNSRSTHLKRCSSDMGVSPADLLQALQRQAEERQSAAATNMNLQTGGAKRKGTTKSGVPAKKKPKKKSEPLDEDTMVALALSSSLLEQHKEQQSTSHTQTASHSSMSPALKWRSGKGRGKRKKGAVPRPPPILLIQDADAALTRLQERVSALLLRSRAPSPPTPTRRPSALSVLNGAAPLWQKSALLNRDTTSFLDFFVPELKDFITPWESPQTLSSSFHTDDKPSSSLQPVDEGPTIAKASTLLSSHTAACSSVASTQATGQLPASSQALKDLVELADDITAHAHYHHTAPCPGKDSSTTNLQVSGFLIDEKADLCVSGFFPETEHTPSHDLQDQAGKSLCQPGAAKECINQLSVPLSTLVSNLSSMVNNPQLSDLQLQVDSGEVFFAHSFMVYARCPLLAQMVHESGFGVQEEGMPAAQRVLISDMPGQAVLVLLQYLYTARFSLPSSLQPHVLELASRFDLQELQQLCEFTAEDASAEYDDGDSTNHVEPLSSRTDKDLTALFNSMWSHDDDADGDGGDESGLEKAVDATLSDREIHDEQVNQEELDEIYEFAATQRNRDEEKERMEESERDDGGVFSKQTEPRRTSAEYSEKIPQKFDSHLDHSLESSYNRLFSDTEGVYKEEEPSFCHPSSSISKWQKNVSPHASSSSKLSARALLQSSASVGSDLSPNTSNLPVPGVSPDQEGNCSSPGVKETAVQKDWLCLKPKSHVPLISNSRHKKEPELIVLSDSSEEMEVAAAKVSPESKQSYTHLKPSVSSEEKHEPSPNQPILGSEQMNVDCSPEVSWLIPSTPVCSSPTRTSRDSSTQTKSSICRTQLFPKDDSSMSSTFNNRPQAPKSVSTHVGRMGGSDAMLKLDNPEVDSPMFTNPKPLHLSTLSHHHSSSKQETSLLLRNKPYSSTPLHADVLQHHVRPDTSLLCTAPDVQRSLSEEGHGSAFESPEKMEFGSLHFSPFSDPSDPPSCTSHTSVQKRSKPSSESPAGPISKLTRSRMTSEEEKLEAELDRRSKNEGEQVEARGETGLPDAEQSCFEQSFMPMDEPPIAFNDSWGFDACDDVAGNPGCFSLRLDDSGGSSRQEQNPGERRVNGSASFTSSCSPPKILTLLPSTSKNSLTFMPSPPHPTTRNLTEMTDSVLVANIWDSWGEDEEEILPLSQRLKPPAQLKTPSSSDNKRHHTLEPITPMPNYSDMDTPELKNKLNRFGVRALPKRQMILKLKEIHQYTHQLLSSEDEDEAQTKLPPSKPSAAGCSSCHRVQFKEPRVPAAISPGKHDKGEEADTEPLSNSQDSNASSTTASEESERPNPELCPSSGGDSDSDGGISASQAATRLQDRLQAVRSFILSDSDLYNQILQYQPLVLSQLQERLKAAGIRLGAAKLVDYLDTQCITFTTAKPGQPAPSRRRVRKTGKKAKAAGKRGAPAQPPKL